MNKYEFLKKIEKIFHSSPFTIGGVLSVLIGCIAGVAAIFFRYMINFFHTIFFTDIANMLSPLRNFSVVAIPALGGLIIGPLIYIFAREAKGHGVPEVMDAVTRRNARIRGRVSIVKALASSINIGSGGSVGREGPIVQICSSVASYVSQKVGANENLSRILIASGTAGGISATFNAPLAGAFFALEVILRRFSMENFGIVVLSSVAGAAVSHYMVGNVLSFQVPVYSLASEWEFLLYTVLGVFAAFFAVAFVKLLYYVEDLFDSFRKVPEYIKPAIGGIGIGITGIFFPQIFGVGYETIDAALVGDIGISLLIVLALVKMLATSITLGSGGSGGVFAPSLFIGTLTGTAFGFLANYLFPGVTGPPGGYGLVGMASVFAGASFAPITAILIVFEMTHDYAIMLPLMLGVVVSTSIARALSSGSIYTLKLLRKGTYFWELGDIDLIHRIRISSVMEKDYPVVRDNTPVKHLPGIFDENNVHGLPVVDKDNRLVGIVTATDLESHLWSSFENNSRVIDIATQNLVVAYDDESLAELLSRPGAEEVGYIPVVKRTDPAKLVGIIRRHDILHAYTHPESKYKIGIKHR